MPDLRQALKDFVATSNSGKYKTEDELISKFPELKGFDITVLKDFVATSNSGKYKTEDELFSKFPEFGIQIQPTKQQAQAQPLKKKEQPSLAQKGMASSSEDGLLDLRKIAKEQITFAPDAASVKAKPVAATPEQAIRFEEAIKVEPVQRTFQQERARPFSRMAEEKKPEMLEKPMTISEYNQMVKEREEQFKLSKPPREQFLSGEVGDLINAIPFIGSEIDDLARAIDSGNKTGAIITPSNKLFLSGSSASKKDIKEFIEAAKNADNIRPSDDMIEFQRIYEDNGSDLFAFLKGIGTKPSVGLELIVSSMASMINKSSALAAGGVVGGAAGYGALATPEFGGVGAVPAAAASLPYAMGAANTVLETGLTFGELLQDELNKKNLEFNEQNVKAILEDEKALSSLRSRASTRGLTIGIIDAMTGKLAGRTGAKLLDGSRAGVMKAGLASTGIEMAGGATGEAVARKAIGQEMDVAEIGFEAFGEAPMGAISLASDLVKKPTYKINGEEVTAKDVNEIVDNLPDEEVGKVKIDITNDTELKNKVQSKVVKGATKSKIKEAVPNLDEESLDKIADLELELEKLNGNTTQVAKDKATEIRGQIKQIQEDAIQKQTTDEGLLRAEQPQVGLQEVGEGDQVAEVVTEEGKPEEILADKDKLSSFLDDEMVTSIEDRLNTFFPLSEDLDFSKSKALAERYMKAKQEGSDPELVNAVEELVSSRVQGQIAEQQAEQPTKEEIVSTKVNIAPFFNTKVNTIEEANQLRESEEYKAYKQSLIDTARDFGLEDIEINDVFGGYKNEAGEDFTEVSNVVTLRNATIEQAEQFAALTAALSPEVQEASIAARYTDANDSAYNANEYKIVVSDVDKAVKAMKEAGISDFSVNDKTGEVTFIDVLDFSDGELENKIGTFVYLLKQDGVNFEQKEYRPVESRYVDKGRRQEILTGIKSTGTDLRQGRENFYNKVEQAVIRDAEFRGIPVDEYTAQLSEDVNAQAEELERLLQQRRESKGGSKKTAAQQNNTRRVAFLAQRALSKISPDTKMILHETAEEYADAVKESPTSQGMFETDTNTIHINLEYADDLTPAHEAFHAILLTRIKTDAKAQAITKEMMQSVRKVIGDNSRLARIIDNFALFYDESLKDEERLAELTGILAIEYDQLPVPAKNAIVRFFEKLAKLFGINLGNAFGRTDASVIEMLNTISGKIARGEAIVDEDIAILGKAEVVPGVKRGRVTIDDIVKTGRANGISDAAIRLVLQNRGFDNDAINTALATEEGVSKKIIVSEEMLTGYDRMMSEVDGIIEKSQKRGVSFDKTLQNAIDYIQGSKAYENASDVQREQMIRDIRKRFGKKEKTAPSISKVSDKPKKKVTVDEYAALKDQIRLEAKAAREAKGDLNSKRKALGAYIKNLSSTGKITAKKAAVIINKLSNVNLDSSEMVERFIDYAGKVFADAEYAGKLSDANTLRKQIKKLSRNKEKSANLRDLGTRFSEIDPSMVDDIDTYNEMASMIKQSIAGSSKRGGAVNFADIVRESDVSGYINETIDAQNEKLFELKSNEIQDLLGIEPGELTYEQLIELLDTGKPLSKENEILVRDAIAKAFDLYSSLIKQSIKTGTDIFTGEDVEYTKSQKKIVSEFMDMDLNLLSPKESLDAVDALMNFMQNKSTSKMGAVVAKYKGIYNAKELVKKGIKASPLKKYWSKSLGRFLGEQTTNLNILFEKMFKGFNRGGMVEDMMGLTSLKNKKSLAESQANAIANDYVNKFYSKKANGQDFNTDYNNIERGMAAFMMRNIIGNEQEIKAEFNRRKSLIEESIDVLANGNEQEVKKSKVYQEVYDNILKSSETIDDVINATDKVNAEAIEYWQQQWDDKYEQLADVSLNVYNKILGKDINYIPDRYTKVSFDTGIIDLSSNESAFHGNSNAIYDKETGVLMEASRPESLPRNSNTGEVDRYIDLSFDKNNANSMYDALIDINTAEPIRQVEAFLNSQSFKKIFPDSDDAKIIKGDKDSIGRVPLYIRNIRRKSPYSNDELSSAIKKLNRVAAIGVGQALGGILQPVKQVVPVAMNTLINAGGLDIGSVFSESKNNFINNSGYAIANRGIESQAQIESINKLIDKAAESKTVKAIGLIEDANKKWLEIFLVKPDVFIARASWMSYYEQSLKEQGINPNTIDYNTHEVNEKAADYAQRMVDRQQNVSDSDLSGKLLSDRESTKQVFVKMLMPFASFRMNQSSRLGADLGTLMSNVATKEDKKIAARSLAGFGVEMAMFKLISLGAAMLINNVVKEVLGRPDDEEKDEKKAEAVIKGQMTSTVSDLFSPLPLVDKLVQAGVAGALEKVQQAADVAEEDAISIYSGTKQDFIQSLGLFGIAADRANQLYEIAYLSNGGSFKDNYGKEKKLTEEDREAIQYLIAPAILTNIGLAPVEVNSVIRSSLNDAKRNAKGEKKADSGSNKSGGSTEDKKDSDKPKVKSAFGSKSFGSGSKSKGGFGSKGFGE